MYDSMENADLEYIYDAYRERSIEIAGTILGNEDEAEDVCQDVFTIIYSMGEEVDFSDRKRLLALIITMSIHKSFDYFKKAYRKYEYANSDAVEDVAEMRIRSGYGVDELIVAMETGGYMNHIFEKLRKKNRISYEIFISVTLYDMPSKIVAEQYHMTENNVNTRVWRTRKWLIREYNKIA